MYVYNYGVLLNVTFNLNGNGINKLNKYCSLIMINYRWTNTYFEIMYQVKRQRNINHVKKTYEES